MPILDPADITFTARETQDLSEVFFENVFEKPDLGTFTDIVEKIKAKQNVTIMGRLNKPVGAGAGGCDPSSADVTINNKQKQWDPIIVSDRISVCVIELKETFFEWATNNNLEHSDLSNTDFANFLEDRYADEISECVFRLAWFGDKNAAITPTGVITVGTNLAHVNKIDGFWVQLFEIVTADANRLTAGLGPKNGQATKLLQEFNDTDTTNQVVTKTLQNMRYGSDKRLRSQKNLVYLVTESVADQYERELKKVEANYTSERLENGFTVLKSSGLDVVSFQFWDRMIETFEDDGTVFNLPHRALLMTKPNFKIGTAESGSMQKIDSFYDKTTKKNHFDFEFNIDALIIKDEEIQVAY